MDLKNLKKTGKPKLEKKMVDYYFSKGLLQKIKQKQTI